MSSPSRLEHLVVARGSRVRLRLKHQDDALDDYNWRCDPELARFDAREPLQESFTDFLARFEYDLQFEDPGQQMLAIEDERGLHIGNIMYYGASSSRDMAEFGISIGHKDYQGHGYGLEATILFLRHVWDTTPFRTLVLHTLEWNERAIRCFRKAGFEEVTRVERHGDRLVQMEARREWWLFHDSVGRFAFPAPPAPSERGS
jgi:RimJ/RimL family protein N-acetyltransferase